MFIMLCTGLQCSHIEIAQLCSIKTCTVFVLIEQSFKPGVHGLWQRMPGFLKSFLFVRQYVCVSALRALITSGVILCDVGHV